MSGRGAGLGRALVFGGSGGIGRVVARELLAQGWHVAITSREISRARAASADAAGADRGAGLRALPLACDVTCPPQPLQAVEAVCRRWDGIEAMVYAVGWTSSHPFADDDEDYWRRVLDVNLLGALRACQAALPELERTRGAAVLVSSDAGRVGTSRLAAYAAAKAGMLGLVRSLALEYAARGVRVNAICPGVTDTGLAAALATDDDTTGRVARRIPMKRLGRAEEVARVAAFLCGPGAAYVTGQAWSVDGGLVTG